jgi:FKBP-type peptidyl-prolyl cis-trans isomerase SlyD
LKRYSPNSGKGLRRRDGGRIEGRIIKLGMSVVDVDFNHPLAGKTLAFELELIERRAASAEELAHGHAHGPGGIEHG